MLWRMNGTRLAALAVFGLVVAAACTAKQTNGQECLKNADCESDRCIQYVCVDPNANRVPSTTDSGTPAADAGADVAADTAAPADTGTPDTGTAADTEPETSADTGSD